MRGKELKDKPSTSFIVIIRNLVIAVLVLGAAWFAFQKMSAPRIKNLGNDGRSIVAFGNSLTYGYGAQPGEDFPSLLAKKVSRPVINLGVSGDTSLDGLARIDEIWEHDPFMVLIEFGGNDRMKGTPFSQTIEAMEKMVGAVQYRGAIAVIVNTGGPFMGAYTKGYKRIAKQRGAVFVPGIMEGIMTDARLKSDAIHPNAAGYAKIAERVFKAIKRYLR